MNKFIIILSSFLLLAGCNAKIEDGEYTVDLGSEMAQQVGDAMASIDEGGGSASGTFSKINAVGDQKTYVRLNQPQTTLEKIAQFDMSQLLVSQANATACNAVAFTSCSSGQKSRVFSACTLADTAGSVTGTVTLTYSGTTAAACTIDTANGNYVSRVPDYTITGLRGATFSVKATSTGQRITRLGSGVYSFSNAGIRRRFTTASGKDVIDITTTTNTPISVINNIRSGRSLSGGDLVVTDNLTGSVCTVTPNSITWGANCNCPTSGNWTGTCTDSSTFAVTFSNVCGSVAVTKGSEVRAVNLDRCQQ